MHCPLCGAKAKTIETRQRGQNTLRRRRECMECCHRFTTVEEIFMAIITPTDKDVLLAYADCDMNAKQTSREIHMNSHNVDYHLDKVKRVSGIDPRTFYGLAELLEQIREGSI